MRPERLVRKIEQHLEAAEELLASLYIKRFLLTREYDELESLLRRTKNELVLKLKTLLYKPEERR